MAHIIAHRGASGDVPENTLESFERAWRDGADGIELDVRLTREGRAVVAHDPTLLRLAGDSRLIRRIAYDELSTIDIGSWKDPRWSHCRVPLLSQVLERVPENKMVYIELKDGTETLSEVSEILQRFPRIRQGVTFIGFTYKTLPAYRRAFPDNPVLWLIDTRRFPAEWTPAIVKLVISRAANAEFDGLDINANPLIEELFIDPLSTANLQLHVWDVDSVDTYRKNIALGAKSITTNFPGRLKASGARPMQSQ